MRSVFITGIGTDVGKTLVSTVIAQALGYDYWKPIQCGSLEFTDSDYVKSLIDTDKLKTHKEAYLLKEPMSPHAAAARESIEIDLQKISLPNESKQGGLNSSKNIVVEGAGGLLVPLNSKQTILDLIVKLNLPVVVVLKNYLGSINHSLLTIRELKNAGCEIIGVIVSGEENRESETIIEQLSGQKILFRIPFLKNIFREDREEESEKNFETMNRKVIVETAEQFKQTCERYFK